MHSQKPEKLFDAKKKIVLYCNVANCLYQTHLFVANWLYNVHQVFYSRDF